MKQGKYIFIVYGLGHIVQEQVLKDLLDQLVYTNYKKYTLSYPKMNFRIYV